MCERVLVATSFRLVATFPVIVATHLGLVATPRAIVATLSHWGTKGFERRMVLQGFNFYYNDHNVALIDGK